MPHRPTRFMSHGETALAAFLILAWTQFAHAFDPATDHTCVYNCGGGGGGGGGYVAPAPSGPSPAEIAARQRRAAALELDKRAHAAFDRGDLSAAARDFEEAARLAPDDSNIQGNRWYTKGMVADASRDYANAVSYYERAIRFYPTNRDIKNKLFLAEQARSIEAHDWDRVIAKQKQSGGSAQFIEYLEGRKALDEHRWAEAIRHLEPREKTLIDVVNKFRSAMRGFESAKTDLERNKETPKLALEGLARVKQDFSKADQELQEVRNYLQMAYEGKKREEKATRQKPSDSPFSDDAKAADRYSSKNNTAPNNPNYPAPPPVYRDANTPRDYPDLPSYSETQKKAHSDNELGNIWAQKGDWGQALLSYQQALGEDPDGPFSQVLKDNIAIATRHLQPDQKTSAAAPAAPPQPARPQDPPKEITASNCTGWMAQAGGTSFRLCTDERAQRYCEQSNGGSVSRVSCQ